MPAPRRRAGQRTPTMKHNGGPPNQQLGAHNVLQGGGWPGLAGGGPGQAAPRTELGFGSLLHQHRQSPPPPPLPAAAPSTRCRWNGWRVALPASAARRTFRGAALRTSRRACAPRLRLTAPSRGHCWQAQRPRPRRALAAGADGPIPPVSAVGCRGQPCSACDATAGGLLLGARRPRRRGRGRAAGRAGGAQHGEPGGTQRGAKPRTGAVATVGRLWAASLASADGVSGALSSHAPPAAAAGAGVCRPQAFARRRRSDLPLRGLAPRHALCRGPLRSSSDRTPWGWGEWTAHTYPLSY